MPNLFKIKRKDKKRRVPRARRKWRVVIINENTLARVMSLKLTGLKARIALLAAIAAIVSLVVMVFVFTPLGRWIWNDNDLRRRYVEMSVRLDSLTDAASRQEAYTANIVAIMSDSIDLDQIVENHIPNVSDTLLGASEEERIFVERFEAENRFNLSVLSPIAAEGMIFESPYRTGVGGPVSAVYRGTVVGVFMTPDGLSTIVVQHPNDFISSYGALSQTFVGKGSKVVAGQRIGHTESDPAFELWRGGVALDASQYIQLPPPVNIAN